MRRAVLLLLLIGAIRIAATYTIFSETADEPMHLSAGLELLSKHQYTIHPANPPLPRLLIAFPPWLAGASFRGGGDYIAEVMVKYYSTGHYKTMLVLSRVGTLLFFFIGALATWAWARREVDDTTALVALLFFTTQPSILGHSGLATVDAAGTAGVAVAMLAFSRWLERPDFRRASVLGAAWGFAISCKLLCIVYVPLACAAIAIVRLLCDPETRARWRSGITVIAVLPAAALIVWAGYGFSMASAIPAPELLRGIEQMLDVNRGGFSSYAMHQWSNEGWWWYFPLTIALKTTLATLLFAAAGFVVARKNRMFLESMAAAGAIVGFSLPTHVNIGIRYILPVYVFLSVAAAIAALAMIRRRQKFVRVAAMLLMCWHLIASVVAHPDYLAYFNEIAGRDPSRYLIDSNLDWGQDILRLRNEVRRLKIEQLGVALFGPANLEKLAFPPHSYIDSEVPTHGWIAVSDHSYRWAQPYGGWKWLDREHCRRIGKSIRLCHVD